MGSFNKKRFLRCFDQLAEFEEGRRNHAVAQLLADLSLPPSASEDQNVPVASDGSNNVASKDLYKDPLSSHRTYKFKFTVLDHNLLQYTLERLIRGLKADRKSSRVGFTVALLSVFAIYGGSIQWNEVIKALLTYTSLKDCSSAEVKDAICGRLYALFCLQRSGFFHTPQAIPELEQVCQGIWEAYDCKIYFQDTACMLLWLISRDVYRTTKDPELALTHLQCRLSILLDPDFVQKTLNEQKEPNHAKDVNNNDSKNTLIGKGLTGVLPCALFGLYIRLHDEIGNTNKSHLKDTAVEKSPLDSDNFTLVLRYVSCIPSNHPVIGSFFDVLIDYILKNDHSEDRLKQLWNSINLTMLDVQGGCSTQRVFTGLRLAAMLFLKACHSPDLLRLLCTEGHNLFRTICRYHRSSKGDGMKELARHVLQLLVSVFQGVDVSKMLEDVDNMQNPAMNDFVMYTSMHKTFAEADKLGVTNRNGTMATEASPTHPKKPVKKAEKVKAIKEEDVNDVLVSSQTVPAVFTLPETSVVDCMFSIAESVAFSASSLTFFHNLFGTLVRASSDIAATYTLLESKVADIDVNTDSKRFYWLLSMLQLCVTSAQREVRMDLLERFFATNALCAPISSGDADSTVVSLGYFQHQSNNYRILLLSNQQQAVSSTGTPSSVLAKGENSDEVNNNKLSALSKHMLNSCFSTLSRALHAMPTKRKDFVKVGTSRFSEVVTLIDVIRRLYTALYLVSTRDGMFVRSSTKSKDTSHLPLVKHQKGGSKKDKIPDKTTKLEDGKMESVRFLSRQLMECSMKLKDNSSADENTKLTIISLYVSTLSLMLLLLASQSTHLSQFLGVTSNSATEYVSQFSDDKMAAISSFAKLIVKSLEPENISLDSVMKVMMSETLIDTVLSDDHSPAFGLLHAISKGFWSISTSYITDDMRDILLQNSVLDATSYDQLAFDVDESDSDSEDDEDDSPTEDEEETEDDGTSNNSSDEDEPEANEDNGDDKSEEEDDDSTSDEDEEDDETDNTTSGNERKKIKTVVNDEESESDIELSGHAVLDELLKDDEGGLEALRMERLKLRMLVDLNPDALKLRLRNLDMLESCIPDCHINLWYVQMVSQLYTGYETAISTQSSRNLDGSTKAVMGEYIRKLGKVLAEAVKNVSSQITDDKIETEEVVGKGRNVKPNGTATHIGKSKQASPTTNVTFSDPEDAMNALLLLTLQAVNGQRAEKTSKFCRNQAVDVFTFALQVESVISGTPVQTTMVLMMALLSASLCKNSRLSTNFFVQLATRNPLSLVHIDLVSIALESKVEFVQSELLSICAMVVDSKHNTSAKVKRLCRRKSAKAVALVMSEDHVFTKDLPGDKAKIVSYITDDIAASALTSLPILLERMKARAEDVTVSSEPNDAGKRPLKGRGMSPQLAKSTGRLVTSLVKAVSLNASKHKTRLIEVKDAMKSLLGALSGHTGKAKQLQPLQAALGQLSRVLGE